MSNPIDSGAIVKYVELQITPLLDRIKALEAEVAQLKKQQADKGLLQRLREVIA